MIHKLVTLSESTRSWDFCEVEISSVSRDNYYYLLLLEREKQHSLSVCIVILKEKMSRSPCMIFFDRVHFPVIIFQQSPKISAKISMNALFKIGKLAHVK